MHSKRIITAFSAGVALSVASGCRRAGTQAPTLNPPVSQEPTTGAAGSAQEEHEDQEFAEDQAEQESAEQESAEEQTAEEAPSEVIMVREPPPRRTYTNPLRVQSAGRKKSGK